MELITITINEMINELTAMARTYGDEQIAAIGVDSNGNFVFFKNGEMGTIVPMFKTKRQELKDEKEDVIKTCDNCAYYEACATIVRNPTHVCGDWAPEK